MGRQDSSGYMEFPLEGRAYKCAGAEGSSSGPSGTSPPYQGQTCPSEIRQLLCCVPHESPVAWKLLVWALTHLASLRAVYIPGVQNRAADLLSRTGPLPGEWRLHPGVVTQLWSQFGRARVDLFASSETTHCDRWFSIRDQWAPLGQDALSQDWPLGQLYAFPPLPLIPYVLHKILTGHYKVLLIAPKCPGRW